MSDALCRPVPTRVRASIVLLAVVSLLMTGSGVLADFAAMAQRLPAETTVVVGVNVAKIMQSPYATEQQWADTMAENWAKRPQMVPPGVNILLMGADVKASTMETSWEVSLMELQQMPDLNALAQAEGGHIDRVWDKDAVASPINAYFVPLDTVTLAAITPGERRAIAKWIRQPANPQGYVTSEYIKGVLAGIGPQTDIVMAIDLEGAVSVPKVRMNLEDSEIPELQGLDLDSVAMTIGSLKGVTLTIGVNTDISGKMVVDFERDITGISAAAKPLMIAALHSRGMRVDDLESWEFRAVGNQVMAEGKLSDTAFKRLLGVVQSPVPAIVAAGKAPGAATDAPASAAEASQRYYKSVSLNIDNLREGGGMSESATWFRNAATRIDHLPILNVDPALLEWGAAVSSRLKQAAATLNVNQATADSRVASVKNPYIYGSYDGDGDYHWTSGYNSRAEYENARMDRRKEGQDQRAKGNAQALKILNDLSGQRQEIRIQMTEKYGIEF